MSLERLTEALQMAQWLPQQKQFFEKWQSYVLPATIVEGTGITVTHDEDLGTLTLATTVPTVVGKHAVPVMAPAILPRQTSGCASLAYLSGASNQPDVAYLAFDFTTAEYAQFAIVMPSSWNEGTVTFVPHWSHPATATNFGVVWKLRAVAVSNDDTLAVSYGTIQSSTDTGGTTNDYYAGPESAAITVAGTPAAGDLVYFEIGRDPAEAADTLGVDAYLIGITIYVTTAAATDT